MYTVYVCLCTCMCVEEVRICIWVITTVIVAVGVKVEVKVKVNANVHANFNGCFTTPRLEEHSKLQCVPLRSTLHAAEHVQQHFSRSHLMLSLSFCAVCTYIFPNFSWQRSCAVRVYLSERSFSSRIETACVGVNAKRALNSKCSRPINFKTSRLRKGNNH